MGFARLVLFSFRSNLSLLLGFPVTTLILSLALYIFYRFYSGGSFSQSWFLVPPTVFVQILLFGLYFAAMPGTTLRVRAMSLAILSSHHRGSVFSANVLTSITLTSVATFLSVMILALVNYNLVESLGVPSNLLPSLGDVVSFWLIFYLAYLPILLYVALLSASILVWGSRVLSEVFNLLVAISVAFLLGYMLQVELMTFDPRPYSFPLYYLIALGVWITGIDPIYVGSSEWPLPGYLPVTIGLAMLIFVTLLLLAWYGYRRLNLGME